MNSEAKMMNDKIRYFIPKLRNRLFLLRSRIFNYLPIQKVSLRNIDIIKGKSDLVTRLHSMLGIDLDGIINSLSNEEREKIIKSADYTLRHEFNLLGSGFVKNDPINWSVDLKTGFEWPSNLFYTQQRGRTPRGSDIKMPWELSRCHHLLWLGEAYILTGEEKYAKEVADELNDWIDKNPLMYTVNWTCAMDVAIRAVNWMYALLFVEKSKYLNDTLSAKVYKSLFQHGFFIINNLEKIFPYSNNHYMSDITGLLYLGELFSKTSKGKEWLKFAKREYFKEALIQILPSGVNYEKSVSYHRLMTELLVYPFYMLTRMEENVPVSVKERLINMMQYVSVYSSPNGNAPLIADNDNGRFLPFVSRDFCDHNYIIQVNSLESKIVSAQVPSLPFRNCNLESVCVEDANVAVLRRNSNYLFISASSRGRFDTDTTKYMGAHLHNDLLSFVFSIGGHDIIVDPGTYCYTSDLVLRKEFRSAQKHNTVIVDGEEQNLLVCSKAFHLKYNSNVKTLSCSKEPMADYCSGEYITIKGAMTHQRQFELQDKALVIRDKIQKLGCGHKSYMSLHFADGIIPEKTSSGFLLHIGSCSIKIKFYSKEVIEEQIIDDTISPSFGVLIPSKTLAVNWNFDNQTEVITSITIL